MSLIRLNFLVLLLHCTLAVSGQWESMHGPFGGFINDIGQNEHYVFVATTTGVYRSSDIGKTWEPKPFFKDARFPCIQFDIKDSLIIADAIEIRSDTSIRRLYKSVDEGESWVELPRIKVQNFFDVAIVGSDIFAFDQLNVWITKNNGQTWKQSLINHKVNSPSSFNHYRNHVYVGDGSFLYITNGDDTNWKKSVLPQGTEINLVYALDSVLMVRDYHKKKLLISDDFGETWTNSAGVEWREYENFFANIDDTIFAAGNDQMYISEDKGHSWNSKFSEETSFMFNLIGVDSILLAGYEYAGLFRSEDFGSSFVYSSEGIDAAYVQNLFMLDDLLLTGGYVQSVFDYQLSNQHWMRNYYDENARILCNDLDSYKGKLYLTANGRITSFDTSSNLWTEDGPEEIIIDLYTDFYHTPLGFMAGGGEDGFYGTLQVYFEDSKWQPFTFKVGGSEKFPFCFAQTEHSLFSVTQTEFFRSLDNGATWQLMPMLLKQGMYIVYMKMIGNDLFITLADGPTNFKTRLIVSHDLGSTWDWADDGIPKHENAFSGVDEIIVAGDYLICTTLGASTGIYFAQKNELHWRPFHEGLPYYGVNDVLYSNGTLYAALNGEGVWKRNADELITTSNEALKPQAKTIIYPNPIDDQLYIQWPDDIANRGHLQIYNIEGSLILDKLNSNFNESIDTKNIPNGIYLLKLKTLNGSHTEKFIVQH